MKKSSVQNIAYLFAILFAVLAVLMILKSIFPDLVEGFQSCKPGESCPEGMFCSNNSCVNNE